MAGISGSRRAAFPTSAQLPVSPNSRPIEPIALKSTLAREIGLSRNLLWDDQPAEKLGVRPMAERVNKASEHWTEQPAAPARRQGALALVGASGEVRDEDLDALIEEICASRHRDTGGQVEIEA